MIITTQDKRLDKSSDRARRVAIVGRELKSIAKSYGCTAIAAEQALGHGAADAVAANQLPWGAVIMLALMLGVELLEVRAKTWQHAVLGIEAGKVDYEKVESMLAAFVGAELAAVLTAIKRKNRTHALDGVGVGLLAGLRPHEATRIVEREGNAR